MTYDINDIDNHLFNWNFQLLSNLLIKCKFKIVDACTKKYSRTSNSDNAYLLFLKIAQEENIHPQTFVYAINN